MALTRAHVVETATSILREYGLGDLTMRRLARELGVAPGALYWHVADKQDLLVAVTQDLLDAVDLGDRPSPPTLGVRLAAALLPVPDAAEVLRVALAWRPHEVRVLGYLRQGAVGHASDDGREEWARGALDLVLGAVADHQEAARAAAAPPTAPKGAVPTETRRPEPPTAEATLRRVEWALTRWSRG